MILEVKNNVKRKGSLFAVGILVAMLLWPVPSYAASTPPVAGVTVAGQSGYTGSIFAWLDESYATGSATLMQRTIQFYGAQNWKGYDQNGNVLAGNANQPQSYSESGAPVQLLTPGTYDYKVIVTDSTGAQSSSALQSFAITTPPSSISASTVPSTGVDGLSASVGFRLVSGSQHATGNGSTLFLNPHAPFVIYDGTSTNVSTETWTVQNANHNTWSGTTSNGPISSNGTGSWSYSRNSGTHWVAPYSYQVQTGGGYYRTVQTGGGYYQTTTTPGYYVTHTTTIPWCDGMGGEHPPLAYSHAPPCQYGSNQTTRSTTTQVWVPGSSTQTYVPPTYSQQYVPPSYTTYTGGNYWSYGSWSNPDPHLISSVSTVQPYSLSESDGRVTYAMNLSFDSIRPGSANFTMGSPTVATQQPLSNLGIMPTGNLNGASETWYAISQKGIQSFSSLAALNASSYTATSDFTGTVAHVVKINDQTYVSEHDFTVSMVGNVVNNSLKVTQISDPGAGQTFPTTVLPVRVQAGGEVVWNITMNGPVSSASVQYTDSTQSLKQVSISGSQSTWEGYYYPSSSQTIPLNTPQGTTVGIVKVTLVGPNGDTITLPLNRSLLIVHGTMNGNGSGSGSRVPVLTH